MTDEKPTASGNRWEPTESQPVDLSTDLSAETWVATSEPAPAGLSWMSRTRAAIAGGVAAVLLAGGLGGFALARATVGSEGPDGADQRQGVPTGFDQDGDDDGRELDRGPVPGGPGPGQQAPQGDSDDDGSDSSNT